LGINGIDDFKDHIFFKGIDFQLIYDKKVKPPFVPRITSETDTRYIDQEFTSEPPQDSPWENNISISKANNFEGIYNRF